MLKNHKFNLSPELYNDYREITRKIVTKLKEGESLYAQTMGEYLNQQGKLFFTGETINEAEMVSFMALVSQYLSDKETGYEVE